MDPGIFCRLLSGQLLNVSAPRIIGRSDTIPLRREDVACQVDAFRLHLTPLHMVDQLGEPAGMLIVWMRK